MGFFARPFLVWLCVVALSAVLAHKKMACLQVLVCGMGEGLWPWPVCVGSAHLYSTGRCAVCVVSVSFSPPSGLGIHLYCRPGPRTPHPGARAPAP